MPQMRQPKRAELPPQKQARQPGVEKPMRPRPQTQTRTVPAGKVVLITGGDSGIGRAVAVAFAAEGADVASPTLVDHAATKVAIVSFTRSLAQALVERGIRVNGVAPGPIWTPLILASSSKEDVLAFGFDVPLGRAGQPNEVAPSDVFLASSDASYMTGQVLHPNGGEIVNGWTPVTT